MLKINRKPSLTSGLGVEIPNLVYRLDFEDDEANSNNQSESMSSMYGENGKIMICFYDGV